MIELNTVTKVYDGGVRALDGVTLSIVDGEAVAIVGPSGSGKSTILHVIGTLDRPTTGSVRIGGREVAHLSDRELSAVRARTIGFVFQQFHLAVAVRAVDNVADWLLYAGVPYRERRRRAISALERVGLGHRLRHRPHELSGGEKQRVAIARAIVGEPALILADEPTGNLDPQLAIDILGLFEEIHETGTTVLFATHDRSLLELRSHRIVVLNDGRAVDVPNGLAIAIDEAAPPVDDFTVPMTRVAV